MDTDTTDGCTIKKNKICGRTPTRPPVFQHKSFFVQGKETIKIVCYGCESWVHLNSAAAVNSCAVQVCTF